MLRSLKNARNLPVRNSHIEKLDLVRREVVDSYDYGRDGSCAIFTLIDYQRAIGGGASNSL